MENRRAWAAVFGDNAPPFREPAPRQQQIDAQLQVEHELAYTTSLFQRIDAVGGHVLRRLKSQAQRSHQYLETGRVPPGGAELPAHGRGANVVRFYDETTSCCAFLVDLSPNDHDAVLIDAELCVAHAKISDVAV